MLFLIKISVNLLINLKKLLDLMLLEFYVGQRRAYIFHCPPLI